MTLPEEHVRLTHMHLERDRVPLVLMPLATGPLCSGGSAGGSCRIILAPPSHTVDVCCPNTTEPCIHELVTLIALP
jgi:hypothetical protein